MMGPTNDVMLDFETFGNGNQKCVCQVGAVYFDRVTGETGRYFKANIDAESHVKAGAIIDASTVYWWLQQSAEARASLLVAPLLDVTEAFNQLNDFLEGAKRIWSHATFDFVTLSDTMKQLGIKPKFRYSAGLDLRTLVSLAGTRTDDQPRTGVHHDALADCYHQIGYAVRALNAVRGNAKVITHLTKLIGD